MKKWLALYGATVLALASTLAFGQLTSTGAGKKATAATYTGPADIVASPTAWYGLRAMSAADRGNKLLNVCNVADVVCADFSSDATTGALVISTVGGSSCSIVTCTIKTMYDRSGNVADITQATISKRPTLTVSCVNGLPCAVFSTASSQVLLNASVASASNPITLSAVANRTGNTSAFAAIISRNNANAAITASFLNASNTVYVYCGTILSKSSVSDSAWHAMQFVGNGASSVMDADGASSTGTCGSGTASTVIALGADQNAQFLTGNIAEAGQWNSAFSAGNRTSMCHNQFTYWGTSVSC